MSESPSSEPAPEEILEQLKQLKVSDVLLSSLTAIAQLGYAKLDPASRDLAQARLAIESLKALVPLLEGSVPEQTIKDFNSMLANLQLAYASAVKEDTAGDG